MPDESAQPRRVEPHPRYPFEVDLEADTTHATVARLVGEGRRVLLLDSPPEHLPQVLSTRGCSVVGVELGHLDELDFEAALGDEPFDVIVAADVLERLKDPLATLRALRPHLGPDGYVVASIPNVAHGSVRLALLEGKFAYQDLGLLDRTNLHFFTRRSIEDLFDSADFLLAELVRHDLPIEASEVSFDREGVPAAVRSALEHDPDALTYQFVVKAFPSTRPELRLVQERMRELALAKEQADRRVKELETESVHALPALRQAVADAHDQLLKRDAAIRELTDEVAVLRRRDEEIAQKEDLLLRLQVRLDQLLASPPVRLYARLRQLPGIRFVVARRTAAFERSLRDAREGR